MPAQKHAINPTPFFELLEAFPCPAWIEDSSGRILARNAHPCPTQGQCLVKSGTYSLPPAGNTKELRLITLFPAKQETAYQHRVISALLAKSHQTQQTAIVDETFLSPRLRAIYRELAQGSSCKEIAVRLGISHECARQHIVRLRRELGTARVPVLRRKHEPNFT